MNPLDLLNEYLRKVERRLRLLAWTRGAAILAACALALTVVLVLIANQFAFSAGSLTVSRTVLFVSLSLAVGFGLLVPLLRMNARRAAKEAEQKFPQFGERLLTFAERSKTPDPFIELVAADALEAARGAEPAGVAAHGTIFGLGSAAAIAIAVLVWLGTAGPGFWGYGTSLLWAGPPRAELSPFYDLLVQPGTKTVRKRSDVLITAQAVGFTPQQMKLMVKYASASKMEETVMRPRIGATGHEFLIAGIPESLEYHVEAGSIRSKTLKLTVIDLPSVKRIRVTYTYPAWSGMKPQTEDPGGDLRAVEGTIAEVAIETDKPLASAVLVVDDNQRIPIANGKASLTLTKDGVYHIVAIEQGEEVRLSDDYFIEAQKDREPTVRIRKPGRDAKANPIEEVEVVVEGDDDFALQDLKLHYSVNAGPEKTVAFAAKGQKTAEGKTLIALEDFKLTPGDIVGMYASARDARKTAKTDIYFIETQPFEKNYTQSQQSGGMGGGQQDQQGEISKRQKEIIVATWNQVKDTKHDAAFDKENAKFLADVQSKLKDQAKSLANRMRSRELAGANAEFQSFVKDMEEAVKAMGPAADALRTQKWQDALGPEQKALQHLLRAEATFRDIQVAFGQQGGGGGGGNGGRDLENLFDLELDTEKNQYESDSAPQSAEQQQKEIDEALQKLEQLAKRQQELADQQKKNQQAFEKRWQQEMLRREAEQLQQKMEQMQRQAQGLQRGQQSQQSQGQQSSSSQQSGQSGQGGQNSQQQQRLQQAIERLRQATKDMQNASSSRQAGSPQADAEARRAAERLHEAKDMLSGMRREQSGQKMADLVKKSEEVASRQEDFNRKLVQEFQKNQGQGITREKAQQMAGEKDGLAGDVKQLEKEMQNAARALAGSDRATSSKMREALGDLQGKEISRNMQLNAEFIRQGRGGYTALREAGQTKALNDLRDKMRGMQEALERGDKGGAGEKGLEQALQQAESLRRQMEQLGRGQQGQRGQQQGQQGQQAGNQQGQQPGQQGKQGKQGQQGQQGQGQQPGQQPGQGQQGQSQQGQQGQQGQGQQPGQMGQRGGGEGRQTPGSDRQGGEQGGFRAMNRGDYEFPGGRGGVEGPENRGGGLEAVEQLYRESMRDLSRMREGLRDDPEMAGEVQDLIREMQRLDPKRFPGNPELIEQLRAQFVGGIANLELQLRRKLEEKQGSSVRSGAAEPVPQGYARSVAEYFRKLSK